MSIPYALVIGFPEGRGSQGHMWESGGICGNFAMQQTRTILVGEMWGLGFTMPQLSIGDWEQVSLD